MECVECDKIVVQEPMPEMIPEYYELTEEQQDRITYQEGRDEWYANVEEYDKKHAEHNLRLALHLISCQNESCREVCKNWEEDKELSIYIKQARSQA